MPRFAEKPDAVAAESKRAHIMRAKPCPQGCKRMPGVDCRACLDRARRRVPEIR